MIKGTIFLHFSSVFFGSLQIERDTYGMLQCHPYPNEYADTSKSCPHCAFFMGLQRKQGVKVEEGQQFDIRGTVDEFKIEVSMYTFWKPGMDIFISHVRRKQIPSYVFPEGYKRSRPPRHTTQQSAKNSKADAEGCRTASVGKQLKRKQDSELVNVKDKPEKRVSVSPQRTISFSPESGSSISGGADRISIIEEGKVESLADCDVDGNSGVQLKTEKGAVGNNVCTGETNDHSPATINRQTVLNGSNILSDAKEPDPEEPGRQSPLCRGLLVPCQIKSTRIMETNQLGLNENLGPLASTDLDNAESKYSRRTAKQREGVVQDDRQLADPCKRTLGAESVLGSNYKIHNLTCEVSFFILKIFGLEIRRWP